MSHLHIPDGVLPTWLWAGGWALALALVWLASAVAERAEVRRKVPLLGVVSALVLVSMSSEIIPIAYHVNLTVLAGVLLGPWLGSVAAFIVVLLLALLGHGGVTVVGLNTLIIAAEMALGWALFRAMTALAGRARVRWVASVATVLTLSVTTALLVGIVALSGAGAATRETGALDPATLRFSNPFAEGVFSVGTLGGEHEHEPEEADAHAADEPHDAGERHAEREDGGGLSVARFAAVVFTLGPIGWLLEALVTSVALGYVARVRPSLVFEGAGVARARPVVGHEGSAS